MSDNSYCPVFVRAQQERADPPGWRGEIWLNDDQRLWATSDLYGSEIAGLVAAHQAIQIEQQCGDGLSMQVLHEGPGPEPSPEQGWTRSGAKFGKSRGWLVSGSAIPTRASCSASTAAK